MKPTTKFRIPKLISMCYEGNWTGALTLTLFSWQNLPSGNDNVVEYLQAQVCNLSAWAAGKDEELKHLVWGYVASCKILSTNSHESSSSLNYYETSAEPNIIRLCKRPYLVEGSLSNFLLDIERVSRYSRLLKISSAVPSLHDLHRRRGLSRRARQSLEPSSRCELPICDLLLPR